MTSTKALKIGRERNESQFCNQGLQLRLSSRFPYRPVLQESLQLQQPFRCDRHSHGLRIKLHSQGGDASRTRYYTTLPDPGSQKKTTKSIGSTSLRRNWNANKIIKIDDHVVTGLFTNITNRTCYTLASHYCHSQAHRQYCIKIELASPTAITVLIFW